MTAELGPNRYGKSAIRLVRVDRSAGGDRIRDLTVAIALEGDFAASYVDGDNSLVVATDTMKNTVYAFATEHLNGAIEPFASRLATHFVEQEAVERATVSIREHAWEPLQAKAGPAPDALLSTGSVSNSATIAGATSVGTAWFIRMAALLIAFAAMVGLRRRPAVALPIAAGTAAVALASLAWNGHGAMDEGATGWVHVAADIVHLLAAGIWVGALLALLLLVFRRSDLVDRDHLILSHRALDGFSLVGSVTVAAIIVSGMVNSWLLVGPANILKLPESLYGQLLIAKLLLFGAMTALAATNRFRLVPAFEASLASEDHAAALAALRRSLAIETGCALAVLALVAWLGTLEPPASAM